MGGVGAEREREKEKTKKVVYNSTKKFGKGSFIYIVRKKV